MAGGAWVQMEKPDEPVLMTATAGTFTYDGEVPFIEKANQPGLCLECEDKSMKQLACLSEDEIAVIEDDVASLKSLLALIRVGMRPEEANETLGFQP
jgi:hypothetical protein